MLSWVKLTISSYEEAPTTWQLVQIPTVSVCLSAGKELFISCPISDSHLERGLSAWRASICQESDWMVTPIALLSISQYVLVHSNCSYLLRHTAKMTRDEIERFTLDKMQHWCKIWVDSDWSWIVRSQFFLPQPSCFQNINVSVYVEIFWADW